MALEPLNKKETLSDRAYYAIRNAIVSNEILADDMLTEEKLCSELSISRTPIRTALHRLVEDGLAEVRGKSIVVSRLTEEDTVSISSVRQSVELLVMKELQGKVTPMLIRKLRGSIEEQARCYMSSADDFMDYIQQDYIFHTALAEATGNRFLLDLVQRINTHSNRCLILSSTLEASYPHAMAEHIAIADALEKRDYDEAYRAMFLHLHQLKDRYFNWQAETEKV